MKIIKLTLLVLPILGYFAYTKIFVKTNTTTYQTATVSKGTLITSIAATGSITSGNTTNISTKASGTVTKVYVKNGDAIKKGQKILDISLDSDGIKNRSDAWQKYLKAQEEVVTAIKDKQDLSITISKDRQAINDAEEYISHVENLTKLTDDERRQKEEAVAQAKLAFDVDAAKFSHADQVINAAKIDLNSTYLDWQDVSGSIISPANGIINNLTLTEGSTMTATTTQSSTTGSSFANSQNIGFVRSSNNQYQAKVNLTEIDAPKVQAGQKVNITMDAHNGKTFTGKVLAVDISGTASSGVSSYPATILMDPTDLPIYPNMSVSANIIVNIESDVLLAPKSAVTSSNGSYSIQLMQNGKPVTTEIEIGSQNDAYVVVKSGIDEGVTVVTGSNASVKNSNTTSVFSNNRQNSQIRMPGF